MTRPAVSKQIQQILLRMAQQGQLRGRVSDDQLVGLLEQVRPARPLGFVLVEAHERAADKGNATSSSSPLARAHQAQAANAGPSGGKISVRLAPLSRPHL